MRTDELDFDLPAELIAQAPLPHRCDSRLLHYRRADRSVAHRRFSDLPGLLREGDVLAFNDARVLPARFTLRKATGGLIEGLFLGIEPDQAWRVMLRNLGPRAEGKALALADAPEVRVRVLEQCEEGQYRVEVTSDRPALELLERVGRMPLPPYIKRERHHDARDAADRERYQTVYARSPGSVAAPTAGLHFTDALLRQLDERGIQRVALTLHVGLGTFKPVSAETLEGHVMHTEAYEITPTAAEAINAAKAAGRRVIAVGTTAARVLESQPAGEPLSARRDWTGIFIYPPYRWKHVDSLITNFHLPRSTLIALVAAMVGLEEQRRLYRIAVEERYRFFSFGDAMWIE